MDTPTPPTAQAEQLILPAQIRRANELAAQVDSALDRAWHTAAVLGYELIKIKESLCHGQFGTLFRKEASEPHTPCFAFSMQMANNYMRLARLCMAAAGKVGQAEALATLFENAVALPAPAEGGAEEGGLVLTATPLQGDLHALANTLHTLAPQARSMRQAMFAFMEPPASRKVPEDILPGLRELNTLLCVQDPAEPRPAPAFAKPNRAGQVRKPRNLEADRHEADRLIRSATLDIGNLIAAGRHVACSPQVRAAACLALEQALAALRAVK